LAADGTCGTDDDTPSPSSSGRTLGEILQGGRLPVGRAVEIAKQMLSVLEEPHALGIVHRDIKPANVIVVGSERKEHVKLIDFGIASNDRAAIKLTVAGIALGTPDGPRRGRPRSRGSVLGRCGVGQPRDRRAAGRVRYRSVLQLTVELVESKVAE
jgi:serine/threonine protein kinase